jgi:hypothetical protein
MSRNYYCLVAGLPNITFEDSKLSYGSDDLLNDLKDFVHKDDYKLFELFKLRTDNENIYKMIVGHEHKFMDGGVYNYIETEEIIDEPAKAVEYITEYIEEYNSEEFDEEVDKKRLTVLYYKYLMKTKNKFVKNWFELELNIRNLFAALNGRKFGMAVEKDIIDINSVSEAILKSTTRDFGLSSELYLTDQLISIFEIEDLLRREKAIDFLKWDWLEENTFFNYFTIEKLISYYIKLVMIERWMKLDPKTGKELFDRFIKDLEQQGEDAKANNEKKLNLV